MLPGMRSLCVLAATAAILVTAFSGIGAGQMPGPRAPLEGATSAAPSKTSKPYQHGNNELLSTWSDHIWQAFPASEIKGVSPDPVSRAYQANNWQPIFINSRFGLDSKAESLLGRLHSLDKDAIDPGPFELDRLTEILKKLESCRSDLRGEDPEFKDSRAQSFFDGKYPAQPAAGASHLNGAVARQPANLDRIAKDYRRCFQAASEADIVLTVDFFLYTREMDPFSPLEKGLDALSGKAPIAKYFAELAPKGLGYDALRSAYKKYVGLAARGGPLYVTFPSKVRFGASGKYIQRLQERLRQEGFYSGEATGVYDTETEAGVRQFQAAHMLKPDGVMGRRCMALFNESFKQKAALIAYSLNAARHSPSRRFDRFIRINSPQFLLVYYKGGQLETSNKVVVGRATGKRVSRDGKIVGENTTPTLVSQIEQIIFNPRWYVDGRIRLELNAEAKSNPEWFAKHGYVTMESKYAFGGYRLFQKPGPKNALGRVKFNFPNPYTVYLHDTPKKDLFARGRRDFSHGCIRVDNALALAQTLLDDDGSGSAKKVQSVLKGANPTYVRLSKPVPISVEYIPVVSGDNGQIVFAGDPYGRVSESSQIAKKGE